MPNSLKWRCAESPTCSSRWLIVDELLEDSLGSDDLARFRSSCVAFRGVTYWTDRNLTLTLPDGNARRFASSEWGLWRQKFSPDKLCVDIVAGSYDCSARDMEHLQQAVSLLTSCPDFPAESNIKILHIHPIFDPGEEPIPALWSEKNPEATLSGFPLLQKVVAVDFVHQAFDTAHKLQWTAQLFRQLLFGLGLGVRIVCLENKTEEPFTTLPFRGLTNMTVLAEVVEMVSLCRCENEPHG